jgi:hypothetical protein
VQVDENILLAPALADEPVMEGDGLKIILARMRNKYT